MNGLIAWSPGVTLDNVEKQVIEKAYAHYRGNKTVTAASLGIAIRTLDNKLERYVEEAKIEKELLEQDRKDREAQLIRARGFVPSQYDMAVGMTDSGSIAARMPEPAEAPRGRGRPRKVIP